MLISTAYAQGAASGVAPENMLTSMAPLLLIFVVFYFLLIRPQQKKMKSHREMLDALRRGDRVVTGGGLIGTIVKVINENEVQVEIAEGVRVRVVRATISEVLAKTEPVAAKAPKGEGAEGAAAEEGKTEGGVKSGLKKLFGGKD